jgi:hypothetical protein
MRVLQLIGVLTTTFVIGVRVAAAQGANTPPLQSAIAAIGATSSRGGDLQERGAVAWLLAGERTLMRFGRVEAIGGLALLQQKRSGSGLTCAIRPYGCAQLEPRLWAW